MTAARALAGSSMIEADGPGGRLFACIGPSRDAPQVSDSRLLAHLRPFPDVQSAVAAIEAAGGVGIKGGKR